MNTKAKIKNDRVALVLLLCAVGELCGLTIFIGVAWWQSQYLTYTPVQDWVWQSHVWGANNTNITWSVKNVAGKALSVSEVRVWCWVNDTRNDVVVNNVAYSGNFTGTTTHTLHSGETGEIAITPANPFSSGITYFFEVLTTSGGGYPVTAKAT